MESIEFRCLVNIPFSVAVLFPLSVQRDMSSLRYAGVASVAAMTYTLIVLCVEMPWYYQMNKDSATIHMVKIDANIFSSFSITFFAFNCQMSLLPIYSELVAPSYRRIKKVVYRALTVDAIFYFFVAGAGYLSTFNATSPVVIERDALPGFNPDYVCLVGAVFICVIICAAFPAQYNPCRNQFFYLVYNE